MSIVRTHRLVFSIAAVIALTCAAALISTLTAGRTTPTAVPSFVKQELGAPRAAAHLTRTTAPETTAKILPSGYEVASPSRNRSRHAGR